MAVLRSAKHSHPPIANQTTITLGLMIATLLAITGCGYGEVSQTSYEISQALYKVCNQQQTERLEQIEALIDDRLEAGEISEQEAVWLREIVDDARAGNWDRAARNSRRMMTDQVGTRPAGGEVHRHG